MKLIEASTATRTPVLEGTTRQARYKETSWRRVTRSTQRDPWGEAAGTGVGESRKGQMWEGQQPSPHDWSVRSRDNLPPTPP